MSCVDNCTRPSLSNISDTETTSITELHSVSVVILTVIGSLASITGILGNPLVMLAVFKSQSLRSIPNFFISSLAFSDFTVCLAYLPLQIYDYNHPVSQVTQINSPFNIAKSFFGHISLTASVTNMFAVTVDRVIAIRFPFKYPAIMTVKTAMFAIGLVWLISLTFGAVYAREDGVSRFIILGYCIALMLGTMSMYAYIFFIAKQQENKVQTLSSSHQPHAPVAEHQKAEKKAAKTIFTIVGIYALCWLPLLLLPAIVNPSTNRELFRKRFPWVQTVLSCNSALNPYVYCLRSHKYRRQFAKLLWIKGFENIHSNTASNTHR